MSPGEIAARLAQRFSFLTSGARTAEARQQTLRATVEWSYALLSDVERRVFNRLSVFRGGWSLTAAEAVVADDLLSSGAVLDTVGRLVERSMVWVERGRTTRYRMLETLREYAAEQLGTSGEAEAVAARHASYFRDVAERAEVELRGHGQRETLRLLREEQPNIRAAITWLSRPGGDIDSALVTAGSLGMFWHLGRHLEGREVLGRLVDSGDGSAPARARALQAVSIVERPRGCLVHPHPRCAETAEESLSIFTSLDDPWHAALSKVLVSVEGVTGAFRERSDAFLSEADEEFSREGDAWGRAVIGFVRLETAMKAGDVAAALRLGPATAAAFRQLEDLWGLSATLYHFGWGLRQFGRLEEGARVLEEAIDVAASAGLWNTVQWAYADLAIEKVYVGDLATARDLFDRAANASREVGDGAGEVLATYGYGLLAEVDGDWPDGTSGTTKRRSSASSGSARRCGPASPWPGRGVAPRRSASSPPPVACYESALAVGRELGEPSVTAASLEGLGRLARARGQHEDGDRMAREAAEIRERFARPAPPHERREPVVAGSVDPEPARPDGRRASDGGEREAHRRPGPARAAAARAEPGPPVFQLLPTPAGARQAVHPRPRVGSRSVRGFVVYMSCRPSSSWPCVVTTLRPAACASLSDLCPAQPRSGRAARRGIAEHTAPTVGSNARPHTGVGLHCSPDPKSAVSPPFRVEARAQRTRRRCSAARSRRSISCCAMRGSSRFMSVSSRVE